MSEQTNTFTAEELRAIASALLDHIKNGYAEGNNDPICTALMKVAPDTPKQFEED